MKQRIAAVVAAAIVVSSTKRPRTASTAGGMAREELAPMQAHPTSRRPDGTGTTSLSTAATTASGASVVSKCSASSDLFGSRLPAMA